MEEGNEFSDGMKDGELFLIDYFMTLSEFAAPNSRIIDVLERI